MPNNVFTVTLAGEDLGTFNEYELDLNDLYLIESTGLSVKQLLGGLNDGRAKPLQVLVWFMRYKRGERVEVLSVNFHPTDLELAVVPTPTKASRRSGSKATEKPVTGI